MLYSSSISKHPSVQFCPTILKIESKLSIEAPHFQTPLGKIDVFSYITPYSYEFASAWCCMVIVRGQVAH